MNCADCPYLPDCHGKVMWEVQVYEGKIREGDFEGAAAFAGGLK